MMRVAALASAVTVAIGGCAQIKSTSQVEVIPKDGAPSIVIGPPAAAITAQGATASWTQHGNAIEFEVFATRRCAVLRHEPVVRVERITRKSGGALYWEFGLGAALLAGGLTGLIRPELFGQPAINAMGETVRDTAAGYRVGGILTALAAVAIGAGIYDVVRSRDEVRYTDAYRPHVGEAAPCDEPTRPLAGRSLELIVGSWQASASVDEEGHASFVLPGPDELDPVEVEGQEHGLTKDTVTLLDNGGFFDPKRFDDATPASTERVELVTDEDGTVRVVAEPAVRGGVLRLGGRDAMAFDFVVPYGSAKAEGHTGEVVIEPQPVGQAPRPPKRADDDTDETSDESPSS